METQPTGDPYRLTSLDLTLLVENSVRRRGLVAEHGLAMWVRADGKGLLWDSGQGLALNHNAEALDIDLATAEAVALSHGHYDHTGGLLSLPSRRHPYRMIAHPGAFGPKFQEKGGKSEHTSTAALESGPDGLPFPFTFEPTLGRTAVVPGIWATGPVPRVNDHEDTGGAFYLDEQLQQEDELVDDQALAALTPSGWVVIFGCGHAGFINTLDYVASWEPRAPIRAALGGFHLLHASDERLAWTAGQLSRLGLSELYPVHCTGDHAVRYLWNALPGKCHDWHAGECVVFEAA